MTPRELMELPVVVNLTIAAEVLDIGKSSAYELVRCGLWPTPVLRLRGSIRIPTAPLLPSSGLAGHRPTPSTQLLSAPEPPGQTGG